MFRRITANPDFVWSVITANGATILNIVVQIVMVPLYLETIGKAQFGVLMILLAIFNYLGAGLGWASAGFQRIIGEHWTRDEKIEAARCYVAAKLVYLGYALLACLVGLTVVTVAGTAAIGIPENDSILLLILMGGYVIAAHDFNVERLTLNAVERQAAGNALTAMAQVVFVVIAVPGLLSGFGLVSVFGGLFAGQAAARIGSACLLRPQGFSLHLGTHALSPFLRRAFSRMGAGYAIYALLLMGLLQGDVLMIGWLGGAASAAEFVLIWKIADVAIQFLWRIPESLVPSLVRMDTEGDRAAIVQIRKDIDRLMIVLGVAAGLGFALLGPWVIGIWVGAENVPDDRWVFIMTGAAIVWLTIYRTSAVFAYALVRLKRLNAALAVELVLKVLAIIALFDYVGYMAPIIAISLFHGLGGAVVYRRIGNEALEKDTVKRT